jgi:ribosomal protein S18 acetylase RimI-like enzyme
MTDMLIKLYALPAQRAGSASVPFVVRKPRGPEHHLVIDWVAREFSAGWASEASVALGHWPVSLYVALRDGALAGFCCYDATARGMVGPIGVAAADRGAGLGAALLRACLDDMRSLGYAYAVAGAVGAPEFFRQVAGAVEIEGSSPGIYQGLLRG